jgi:RNA polymerase sigma factor (TIGR02999 family)
MTNTNDWFLQRIEELRTLARQKRRAHRPGQTVLTSDLVDEAWARLVDQDGAPREWESEAHFFGSAARAMRNHLIDHLRRKRTQKRGYGWTRQEEAELLWLPSGARADENARYFELVAELEELSPEAAAVIDLRRATSFTPVEVRSALEISRERYEALLKFAEDFIKDRTAELEDGPRPRIEESQPSCARATDEREKVLADPIDPRA